MINTKNTIEYWVKNNRNYYYSYKAMRVLPISKNNLNNLLIENKAIKIEKPLFLSK